MEESLYQIVSQQARVILNIEHLSSANLLDVQTTELSDYAKHIEMLKDQKRVLYEQLLMREISLDDYKRMKAKIDMDISHLEQSYSLLRTKANQMQMDEKRKMARSKMARKISEADALTAELTDALFERIYVYPENRLDIEWKIKDFCEEV